MKKYSFIILLFLLVLSCKEASNPVDPVKKGIDYREDFKRIWARYDSLYPLFDYKKIDWQSVYTSNIEIFRQLNSVDERNQLLLNILKLFQDEHIYIYTPGKFIAKPWVSPRKPNVNEEVFASYKSQMNWIQVNNYLGWGKYNKIGYIRIDDVAYFDLDKFDLILDSLKTTNGLIIDLRKNEGGYSHIGAEIIGRFISSDMDLGYILWRNGQGHNDFAPLSKIYAAQNNKIQYTKKIAVLIGVGTKSVAELVANSLGLLDNVSLVGDTTLGNITSPMKDTLKDGTIYTIPYAAVLDINMQPFEGRGAIPDYFIRDDESNLYGKDPVIDFAMEYLKVNNAYNIQLEYFRQKISMGFARDIILRND